MPLTQTEFNSLVLAFREKGLLLAEGTPKAEPKPAAKCGPAKTSATATGDPNTDVKVASKSAHDFAKDAAAATCTGDCSGITCTYVEEGYSATSTRAANAQGVKEWTFTGTSSGRCECE